MQQNGLTAQQDLLARQNEQENAARHWRWAITAYSGGTSSLIAAEQSGGIRWSGQHLVCQWFSAQGTTHRWHFMVRWSAMVYLQTFKPDASTTGVLVVVATLTG